MEEWDIYDENRIKTGKIVQRGAPLGLNEFHLVVHVCLINSNNQLLIQQRQPFKAGWPNMWDVTVGGSALAGENSRTAAEREVFEEIGYKADLRAVRPAFTINFKRGFDDYYILIADVDIRQLKLQKSEVQNIKWADKEEVIHMIRKKTFIPYRISLIEMIFEMKNGYSAHSKNA
ncbi:MAG: NUDIX domain-containing protein [Bacteroidota bacterium]